MKEKIRILLVDDHAVVRFGIRSILERNDDLEVCGEAGTLAEAYEKVKETEPDIVILDMRLPDGDGLTGCQEIRKIRKETKVIILTAYADESTIRETMKAGAHGYLSKTIDSKAIISCIHSVNDGTRVFDNSLSSGIMENVTGDKDTRRVELTSKEEQILDELSLGKTNKEIAQALFISEKTVRNYVSMIMKKLEVSNRTEATIYWLGQKSHR